MGHFNNENKLQVEEKNNKNITKTTQIPKNEKKERNLNMDNIINYKTIG